MRIFVAALAAAFLLIAGQLPASAAPAGQALILKQSYGSANAAVDKAGWRHRRHHRHWRRHHHRRWYGWWW
jgi:hypothetical protein